MIGNSISLDSYSETSAESAQSITSVRLSATGLRPNPADIGSEVRTREETKYTRKPKAMHELKRRHSQK